MQGNVTNVFEQQERDMINEDFKKWATGYSGFDGGNPNGKIWLCGIEWGGASSEGIEDIKKLFEGDVSKIPTGYTDHNVNLNDGQKNKFQYNYKFLKVMATIKGKNFLENGSTSTKIKEILKKFNDEEKCFTEDSNYFKLNLLPFSFPNIDESNWSDDYKKLTSYSDKNEYEKESLNMRFKMFQKMVKDYKPLLIITNGTTQIDNFKEAFGYKDTNLATREFEDDKTKKIEYFYDKNNTRLFVNIPFLGRPLNSNCLLIETGKIIKKLLEGKNINIDLEIN